MRYASGREAWGMCDRGGHRVKLSELSADGQSPGLMVCRGCRDIKHPQDKPILADDAIALKHPRPDHDDDSVGSDGLLLTELPELEGSFGATATGVTDALLTEDGHYLYTQDGEVLTIE